MTKNLSSAARQPLPSTITVHAEEMAESKEIIKLAFGAVVPKKKMGFSRPDPFVEITRPLEDGSSVGVYRSPVKNDSSDPIWDPVQLPLQTLCQCDKDRVLTVRIYDWEKSGDHIPIGTCTVSVNEMMQRKEFDLFKPDKREKIGSFRIHQCTVEQIATFLDYIRGGCQIQMTVAIDFTQSNGEPTDPRSLHYFSNQPNSYQQAIRAIGDILQEYDSDKKFPVYGFGAKLPNGTITHCWPLTGNEVAPEVNGVDGLLSAYELALKHVALWGPTNFSPVINHVARQVQSQDQADRQTGQQHYTVLLIITDLDMTIRAIVNASSTPMSIIIVGVGNAEFNAMSALDADTQPLVADGKQAERDIVQFVAMRDMASSARLAKELLAELPYQIVDYFRRRKIPPKRFQ